MLKVYCANFKTRLTVEEFQNLSQTLPGAITDKFLKFIRWQDAHAALMGKLLLKEGLKDMGYCMNLENLKYTIYNRPYLDNCPIDFNISHSGEYVLCALSTTCSVGIDIEQVRPVDLSDFESQWTLQELDNIRRSDDSLRQFYNYWTRKEAVIKANGKGLSLSLNKINATIDRISIEGKNWYVKEIFISDDYCSHLATDVEIDKPITINRIDFLQGKVDEMIF
ncbi:4'-phosphopantetheinyl transferase family protein [Ohtaekwangia sp.]|uniref:4'-phosphopantetheinyl transferase family protein n=1 Tax=Ohtaekwangia sp. TaxID=2066019 RepID=UPI002FDE948D